MGQAVRWALYACAGLLVLYAGRVLLQKRDPDRPGAELRLGCGFYFLACILGALASQDLVGGAWNAARLGVAAFLLLPAAGALTRSHGSRLLLGITALFLSVVLAGPVVNDLWTEAAARREGASRLTLEQAIEDLETAEQGIAGRLEPWRQRDLELRGQLKATGYATYAELAADAEALALLTELESVQGKIAWAEGELTRIRAQLGLARTRLASLEARASEQDDLGDLGLDVPDVSSDEYLTPVERYARQKELEALFERELGGK